MPSILDKIQLLVTNNTRLKSVRGIISLSATLDQMSRGMLVSSIASIDLLFIIFSRKLAEYAHKCISNSCQVGHTGLYTQVSGEMIWYMNDRYGT